VGFLGWRFAGFPRLRARGYERWHPCLDEALSVLPESEICPHELFRLLVQNPGPFRKKAMLVLERGAPAGLVGLRQRAGQDHWELVTQWLVPGVLFPVREGYAGRVLTAINADVHIAWWRSGTPPEPFSRIRDLQSAPTHGMRCADDFEGYWHSKGRWKGLMNIRNRCRRFDFRVNAPGMVEWTIRQWGKRWQPADGSEMPELADRLLVGQYLARRGLCHALSLHDQGTPIASATLLSHRRTAVAYVNYRDPQYDWYAPMTRLIDLSFAWARDMCFERMDIGGGHDYKDHWAPIDGEKWEFDVLSEYSALARLLTEKAHAASRKLSRFYQRVPRLRSHALRRFR